VQVRYIHPPPCSNGCVRGNLFRLPLTELRGWRGGVWCRGAKVMACGSCEGSGLDMMEHFGGGRD
jgi:hypothetical protein